MAFAQTAPRLPRRIVFVEVRVQQRDELFLRRARNVSAGGMFLDSPVPLPVGTRLSLSFSLPSGEEFEIQGEVRWNTAGAEKRPRHPGMGVVFVEYARGDAAVLEEFVADAG